MKSTTRGFHLLLRYTHSLQLMTRMFVVSSLSHTVCTERWTAGVLVVPSAFAAGECSKSDANVQAEVKPTCDAQEFRDALPPLDKRKEDT